jgi:superfamily II DNA/RNA helicase
VLKAAQRGAKHAPVWRRLVAKKSLGLSGGNGSPFPVKEVKEVLYHVERREKFSLLLGLLKREKGERVLIFTNTKRLVNFRSLSRRTSRPADYTSKA